MRFIVEHLFEIGWARVQGLRPFRTQAQAERWVERERAFVPGAYRVVEVHK